MTEEEESVPVQEAENEAENERAATAAQGDHQLEEEADEDEEEYVVEEIRAKRRNPKTGNVEYYIKWENYPENQNTWEPSEHLKCPDLIKKFNERIKEKAANKRLKSADSKESQAKRAKRLSNNGASTSSQLYLDEPLLVEDELDNNGSNQRNEPHSSHDSISRQRAPNSNKTASQGSAVQADLQPPKGFARNLPIDKIVGSCTDQKQLWFFVRWRGLKELELVELSELEDHAPRELCSWYRERLFHLIKLPDMHELPMQTA